MHSWTELRRDPDGRLHLDGEHRGEEQAAARRLLDAEAERVRQRVQGLSVGTELGEEPALSTLLHQARGLGRWSWAIVSTRRRARRRPRCCRVCSPSRPAR
ncbi:hypothetical protein ACFQV8_10315 [Pseudonocardia benzenivorans]